jgi:hypothetical protein
LKKKTSPPTRNPSSAIFRYPHPCYFPSPSNQLCKPRIHGRSSYSDNKKYSRELSQHSNCQGCAQARACIFVGRLSGNGGRPSYGNWHKNFQHHYSSRYATTLPNLQISVPVILLKNLDGTSRLCNGTRLIIWRLTWKLIIAQIISGTHARNIFNILHITTTTNRLKWPFTLQRRQFPLQLAFAMTINKAQGQTMKTIGIYLLEPIFTHGQLYVVLSRATRVNNVSVFCPNGRTTTNVVYMELLRWFLFSIYCMLFFLDGSEFPHPNHELKFPALDAKMATTEVTFMTCGCWK